MLKDKHNTYKRYIKYKYDMYSSLILIFFFQTLVAFYPNLADLKKAIITHPPPLLCLKLISVEEETKFQG